MKNNNFLFGVIIGLLLLLFLSKSNFQLHLLNFNIAAIAIGIIALLVVLGFLRKGFGNGKFKNILAIIAFLLFMGWLVN